MKAWRRLDVPRSENLRNEHVLRGSLHATQNNGSLRNVKGNFWPADQRFTTPSVTTKVFHGSLSPLREKNPHDFGFLPGRRLCRTSEQPAPQRHCAGFNSSTP